MNDTVDHEKQKVLDYLQNRDKKYDINIINIIKKTSADRLKFFNTLILNDMENEDIHNLKSEGLVIENEDGNTIPTMELLVQIQYSNIQDLAKQLNKEYFTKLYQNKKKPLDCAEKSIILALLGILAVDQKSAIKFKDKANACIFKEIVEKCKEFLGSLHVIDSSSCNIWNRHASLQNDVQAKMDRLDYIKSKTNNIYCKSVNGHYLNIITSDGTLNKKYVNKLMDLIFDTLSLDNRLKLIDLFTEISKFRNQLRIENNSNFLALRYDLNETIKYFY